MEQYEFPLSTGTLKLDVTSSVVPVFNILSIGERINPKRPFMFVSHLVGRYVPTRMADLRKYSNILIDMIPLEDFKSSSKVSCISLSETGLLMGATITQQIVDKLSHPVVSASTTRVNRLLPILCEFLEPHSHLANHRIYLSDDLDANIAFKDTEVLVMIDDEITTGNTLINLFKSLKLTKVHTVILLSLTDWSRQPIAIEGVDLKHYALVKGEYSWEPKEGIDLPDLPYKNILKEESKKFLHVRPSDEFYKSLGPKLISQTEPEEEKEPSLFNAYSFNSHIPDSLLLLVNESGKDLINKSSVCLSLSSSPLVVDGFTIKSMHEFPGFYNDIPLYLYNIEETIYKYHIKTVRIVKDNDHLNKEFMDYVCAFFNEKFPRVKVRNY